MHALEDFWAHDFPLRRRECLKFLSSLTPGLVSGMKEPPRELLLAEKGALKIFFSPFHEVEVRGEPEKMRVFIVGLTPGFQQAHAAMACYVGQRGGREEELAASVREEASFKGSMRANMVSMLDELGLNSYLGLETTMELFTNRRHQLLMESTSLLQFPVFVDGANYTGSNPRIASEPLLRGMVDAILVEELKRLGTKTLIVPLGKTVEEELRRVIHHVPNGTDRCLWGFPHSSGANGHRKKFFAENKKGMKEILAKFFGPRRAA